MILSDFHLHSSHSEDSEAPMEQQIEAGIKAGLKYMCFTEHMDKDFPGSTDDKKLFEIEGVKTYDLDYIDGDIYVLCDIFSWTDYNSIHIYRNDVEEKLVAEHQFDTWECYGIKVLAND